MIITPKFFAPPSDSGNGWRPMPGRHGGVIYGMYYRYVGEEIRTTNVPPECWPKESRRELAVNTIIDQPFF